MAPEDPSGGLEVEGVILWFRGEEKWEEGEEDDEG